MFLEVQFRSLQRIQDEMIVGETEVASEEVIAKNLRTTERLVHSIVQKLPYPALPVCFDTLWAYVGRVTHT